MFFRIVLINTNKTLLYNMILVGIVGYGHILNINTEIAYTGKINKVYVRQPAWFALIMR